MGMEAIYLDVNARKRCCTVRKGVAPCKRCARARSLWITGLRRGQSDNRSGLEMLEAGTGLGAEEAAPAVADWTDEEINVLPCPVIDMSL